MTRLAWDLLRAGGWARPALLAVCTAVVTGLVLVAVALLNIRGYPDEPLWSVAVDPNTRVGMVFAIVLLGLPPLLLLYQAVRLGTAARERRLAALRLAGATPAEVRRVGAVEVGVPALLGSVLGIGVYWLLRIALGARAGEGWFRYDSGVLMPGRGGLGLVPTTVGPTWWQYVLVVLAVTALGVGVGRMAGRGVVVTPLGVSRGASRRPPRPWGALLLLAGVAVGASLVLLFDSATSTFLGVLAVGLMVAGVMTLSSWTAYRVGRYAAGRAGAAHVLLAARRLVADPRPAGRAAAAVGGIALVAGGCAAFLADVLGMGGWDGYAEHVLAALLVLVLLVLALVAVIGSVVHSVESLLDRKRSVSGLVALGTPPAVLAKAQRWEAGLVALPMTVAGVLLGSALLGVGMSIGGSVDPLLVPLTAGMLVASVLLVWLAIVVAVRITRPWARLAAAPANLRTE